MMNSTEDSNTVTKSPETIHLGPNKENEQKTIIFNEKPGDAKKELDILNTIFIIIIPVIGILSIPFTTLQLKTAILAITYFFSTGLGITAGSHRLWSHRSYSASLPLRIFLALASAGAVQGSIKFWARGHRVHHRYTDTEKDPYSIKEGVFHAHLGWMLFKSRGGVKRTAKVDISDLDADPVVAFQHRHYLELVLLMAFAFPSAVAGLGWGDWLGGLVYAGIIRMFAVQQSTFCLNSLAHWLGDRPFDDKYTPRNNLLTAVLILGEGWHNFHHEFPSDYRAGIEWYQYDPTKWAIAFWKHLGLASNLNQFVPNEIDKGRLQQSQKTLDHERERLDWGTPIHELPVIGWDDYTARCKQPDGRALICIAGIVHDATEFVDTHPGGKAMIMSGVGKDATEMFNGGVYAHHNAAHNLLSTMRVAVVRNG